MSAQKPHASTGFRTVPRWVALMTGFIFSFVWSNRKRSRNGIRHGLRGGFQVCSAPFIEPGPSEGVLGPSLARKRLKFDQNYNTDFSCCV